MKKRICKDCGDLYIAISSIDICPACQRASLFERMTADMRIAAARIAAAKDRKVSGSLGKLNKTANVIIRRRGSVEKRIAI